ncbi:MAG: hypothetical protein ACFCVD_22675 [Nodosilinea sp.]
MKKLSFDQAFAAAATVAVVTGLVAGFWVLGTPGRQRSVAADRQRLQDLGAIAQTLHQDFIAQPDAYTLPAALDAADLGTDPLTNQPYEFQRLSDQTFALCAQFDTDSSTYPLGNRPLDSQAQRWQHPQGRHCFEFEVSEYPDGFYYP